VEEADTEEAVGVAVDTGEVAADAVVTAAAGVATAAIAVDAIAIDRFGPRNLD
jgi:hypothetical protein